MAAVISRHGLNCILAKFRTFFVNFLPKIQQHFRKKLARLVNIMNILANVWQILDKKLRSESAFFYFGFQAGAKECAVAASANVPVLALRLKTR